MQKHELVIVGGSLGGIQSAICAQKHHKMTDILVIRREKKVMVSCGIPYIYGTLGGAVDKCIIPDKMLGAAGLRIDEVVSIDRKQKTVVLRNGGAVGYEKLLLGTGSRPIKPPIPGVDLKNVYAVTKDPDYLHALAQAMDEAQRIVVIGGGFIGVEFADECRKRGHDVTIVELLDHCLQLVCTKEMSLRAEELLRERGVNLRTGNAVKAIGGNEKVEFVELNDGEQIPCDMVIMGIGVAPNTSLAQEAGLEIGPTGGIKVDEFQRTNDPDIFAAGDCAEKYSFFNGEPVPVRLASVAAREGKVAAANLYSARWRNVGTVGAFSTVIGDTGMAMSGLTDAQAAEIGYNVVVGEAEAPSKHPGTLPGAMPMRVRLLFDRRSGKLLGGGACCTATVGEVGNLISACIVNGMTMEQVALFPMGTHPWLTATPLAYQLTDAASDALHKVN